MLVRTMNVPQAQYHPQQHIPLLQQRTLEHMVTVARPAGEKQ